MGTTNFDAVEVIDGFTARAAAALTGAVALRFGDTATEGLEFRVYEATVSPTAISTNLLNLPAKSFYLSIQANVETALTGGGTTVAFSIGTAGDPDKYGTAATLTKNTKLDTIPALAVLASAEQLVLGGSIAGGATLGNTALTVGSVRVRAVYVTVNSLDDAV